MDKKYQVFISSTYEDLKEERQKAIDAVLQLNQFPAGMEMFSAANEEQWEIIRETIDSSDYYVLIVGMKYGSIIASGEDQGISYTEKEFDYAVLKGIPVLAFLVAEDVAFSQNRLESDPAKLSGLCAFKNKVKTGRMVKFWHNGDELAAQLSQALSKAMLRGNRPGWIRTTEFDMEKSLAEITRLTEYVHKLEALNAELRMAVNRKPNLYIEMDYKVNYDGSRQDENLQIEKDTAKMQVVPVYMKDAEQGIDYRSWAGGVYHASREKVKALRHICQNGFPIRFRICNEGDMKATGARIRIKFPDELLVLSKHELDEYIENPKRTILADDSYNDWERLFYAPEDTAREVLDEAGKFISKDELVQVDEVADLLDPCFFNEVVSIFPGEVSFKDADVRHKGYEVIDGVYILPTVAGRFTVQCEIICDEYSEQVWQELKLEVS